MDSLTALNMINCFLNAPLMFISIIGNALVLAAILRTRSLRSPSTVFLFTLAVSDLLVGFVVQPVYIAHELKPGPLLRLAANGLFNIACGVSLCTMAAISVDRFLALYCHMRYQNLMTTKRAIYTSAIISFMITVLSCLSLWHKSHAVLAAGIVICLLVSTFSYTRIYFVVHRHLLQIQAQQQAMESLNAEHDLNIVRSKKSAVNTFIYCICMILCLIFPTHE